ncbi:putative aspartic-type endopeptidase [Escovopsis weberi]|uniref:Putative aspartic-type endopeptidase n=1 Tax=Escovopsis weberi TaxID=150374 RepID=A0A0M8N3E2_ESCWE|nr:putative aspartic-type endopeptidase [Escovopsis weberi]
MMRTLTWLVLVLSGLWAVSGVNVPQIRKHGQDWDLSRSMNGLRFERAKASRVPSRDVPTARFSRLRATRGLVGRRHTSTSALSRVQRNAPGTVRQSFQNISAVGEASTQYAVQCSWDGAPVWLLLDTGSADTWAAKSEFRCSDGTGAQHGQSACGFGRPYVDGFSHGEVPDVHFSLRYGSGEYVSGPMGLSDVSCGGASVTRQQVGLANSTYWHGNNVTVGILGLAYGSITSAYYGETGREAPWNAMTYTPFLTRAISQGGMKPVFSVGLSRNGTDGVLAWGGLPMVDWGVGAYASTELIIANLIGQEETSWKYSFYTIVPDGVRWDHTTDTTKYPYIIDTGTTMMYLPPPLAEAIAMAFQPRAVYLYQWGTYFAPCDTVAPRFAVIIGGVEFWINPADLVYRELVDPLTGYCAVGIASGGAGPYILGDVFLQNVLAVFDVGAAEMRFYARDE